jgi:hypothetical protein
MQLALSNFSPLEKLVVVDVSPTKMNLSSEFSHYIQSMKELERKGVKSHKEANDFLQPRVKVSRFGSWL